MIRRNISLWLLLTSFAALLNAHTISLTYADVAIDPAKVVWSLKLPVPEMDLLLSIDTDHDGRLSPQELSRAQPEIQRYVMSKLGVADRGRNLPGVIGPLSIWTDPEGHLFIQTQVIYSEAGRKLDHLSLRCDMLREVVSAHQTIAKIDAGGQTRDFVFQNGQGLELDASPSALATILQFVKMGVLHIFTGYDHIAFLLGVVLIGGSFKSMLKVVTSFTVAHSITLALAAFQIVSIPSRVVESGIALSIMYIAVENVLFHGVDRRWIVTFFFGLVHGFGFASALQEVHLPQGLLATALFSFNLGVECGQLCIVALLLPLLLYISKRPYRQSVVRTCSAMIFLLGSFWLWERLTGH